MEKKSVAFYLSVLNELMALVQQHVGFLLCVIDRLSGSLIETLNSFVLLADELILSVVHLTEEPMALFGIVSLIDGALLQRTLPNTSKVRLKEKEAKKSQLK
jgi:hypothetical protein